MKKIISIVVAFALVLSMGVCGFAAERPADEDITVETLGAYYVAALNEEGADIPALAQEFVDDMALFTDPGDTVRLVVIIRQGVPSDVFNAFVTEVGNIAGVDITLPSEPSSSEESSSVEESTSVEESSSEESTLEEDTTAGENGGTGGFLDTILGVLGGIGDILFGDGGEVEEDPTDSNTSGDGSGDDIGGVGDGSGDDDGYGWGDEADYKALAASLAKSLNAGEMTAEAASAEIVAAYEGGVITKDNVEEFVKLFKEATTDATVADEVVKKAVEELQSKGVTDIPESITQGAGEGGNSAGSDSQVSNTGDTAIMSVAAVALVAGAALVLTRKKSEDAE